MWRFIWYFQDKWRNLSFGGGQCQYPKDWVPPCTSSKSRQGAGRVSTHCHVSCSLGSHLPAEVGSGAITCHAALDLVSVLRWAPMLPRVPRLRSLPFWEVSSSVATCPMALGSAFLRGDLRCCHVSHGPRRAVDHRNKERLSCPKHAASLTCFHGTLVRYRSAYKTCSPLQCGSIVQRRPSWSLLDMATEVIRPDRTAPRYRPCSVQQNDKTGRLHAANDVQDIICYS
jgi:hypothetical protein